MRFVRDRRAWHGRHGEVWLAHDTSLKRDVALEVLPAAFVADADRLARFQREAEILAALNHPNIARVYGLEKVDGTRFAIPISADQQFGTPTMRLLSLSPDGRYIVYATNEPGTDEVDLRPYPDVTSRRIVVSAAGGSDPQWRAGGGYLPITRMTRTPIAGS
jgi:hypothetical protein